MSTTEVAKISSAFLWRRVHSLMGLWLIVYLLEHLIVNSQAALWLGDDGVGFIRWVNLLESLPFLQVIEWLLIGIPLLIHGIWGVRRALQSKANSFGGGGGNAPRLNYGRNRAFTWQRLTSWLLLIGIVGHVVQMRFIGYPIKIEVDDQVRYLNRISSDEGLYTLSARLGVTLYSCAQIAALKAETFPEVTSEDRGEQLDQAQRAKQRAAWIAKLSSFRLNDHQVIAQAKTPGVAMLLMVRDHFKSPLMASLYTIFVLAAAFHAFNGFWTALITWGAVLSYRSQRLMLPVNILGIVIVAFLGLAAIWGSYWINLRS